MSTMSAWLSFFIQIDYGGLTSPSGVNKITGFFDTWVKRVCSNCCLYSITHFCPQNSVIGDELSKTFNYQRIYKTLDHGLGSFSVDIYAWEGEGHIDWGRDESGNLLPNMRRVCTLKADLSNLQRSLKVQKGPRGQDFWRVEHSVAVLFGGTQLRARLQWYEGVSASFLKLMNGPCKLTESFCRINCVKVLLASSQTLCSKFRNSSPLRQHYAFSFRG
jgi:hypothetical protein